MLREQHTWKAKHFWTFSWPIPPRKCWYSRRGGSTNTFWEESVKRMSRKCLAFQICCSRRIGNKLQKTVFKKRKLRPKNLLRTLSKMTGRKWSDIAQYPKWPLCGHRDVNSQWAYCAWRRPGDSFLFALFFVLQEAWIGQHFFFFIFIFISFI